MAARFIIDLGDRALWDHEWVLVVEVDAEAKTFTGLTQFGTHFPDLPWADVRDVKLPSEWDGHILEG